MRYDDELFSKVMGFPCDSIIECNMKEDHIEYYRDEYNESFPYEISKEDLEEKCLLLGLTLKDLEDTVVEKELFNE